MPQTQQEIEREQLDRFNRETSQLALTRKRALLNAAADDNVDASRDDIIDKHVEERMKLGEEIKEMLKTMKKVNGFDRFVSSMMEIVELCKKNAEYLHTYDPLHNVVLLAINPLRWHKAASAVIPERIKEAYTAYRNQQMPANKAFDVQQAALDKTQVDQDGNVSFVHTNDLLNGLLPGIQTIPEDAKNQVAQCAQQSIIAMQMGYFASLQDYNVEIDPADPTRCRVTNLTTGNPMTQEQLTQCKAGISGYINSKKLSMNIKTEPVTPPLAPPSPRP